MKGGQAVAGLGGFAWLFSCDKRPSGCVVIKDGDGFGSGKEDEMSLQT